MAARVAVPSRTGAQVVYPAAVIAVAAGGPVAYVGSPRRRAPGPGECVRLALEGGEDLQAPDGAPCRIEIILGRTTPLGLLVAAGRGTG